MKINDRVYGEYDIKEEVLIEIIKSKPLQRLKGINQAGASVFVFKEDDVTRFEHSLGVMILLQKLGAAVEEQAAGLMHDIPHTAFSHVVDFVFKNEKHDYHERFHEKMIMDSEIPAILKRHGMDPERVMHHGKFPLLEQDLPELCADRIDYALRVLKSREGIDVKKYVEFFTVIDGKIVIDSKDIAEEFASDFIKMVRRWNSPIEIAIFQIMADAIKKGIDKGVISEDELFEDDDYLYSKLSADSEIKKILDKLKPGLKVAESSDGEYCVKNKMRYVDPFFPDNGRLHRVSEVSEKFKRELAEYKESCRNICVKVL